MHPTRRPRAASSASPIPTLATVLAGGAMILGCQELVCGESRATELEVHGLNGLHEARDRNLPAAAHEIAIALGLSPHIVPPTTLPVPYPMPSGGVGEVTPMPPEPPETNPRQVPIHAPLDQPPTRRGGLRHVGVHPPPAPPPPQAILRAGDMGAVTVFPANRRRV